MASCGTHGPFRAGCARCQRADRAYNNRRRQMIADGSWQHPVPAEIVVAHIDKLRATMSMRGIARAADLPQPTIKGIVYETPKAVRGPTAAAILSVEPRPTPPVGHVLPTGAARRLRALVAAGYTMSDLGRRLGWRTSQVWEVVWAKSAYVADRTHVAVAALYDDLADVPGTSRRAKNLGARNGWLTPDAWVNIDDPDAEPDTGDDDFVDAVRVERILAGTPTALTPLERHHAVHAGIARGMSVAAISGRLGVPHSTAKALASKPLPAGYELVA